LAVAFVLLSAKGEEEKEGEEGKRGSNTSYFELVLGMPWLV